MQGTPVANRKEPTENGAAAEPAPPAEGFLSRTGAVVIREFNEIWPPTLFFIIGFNFIALTTNLILANCGEQFTTYLLATVGALVVGKVLPIANATSLIRRYDRAPLIRPILFKTVFYWAAVFIGRLIEHWVGYIFSKDYQLGGFVRHLVASFSWDRFIAIQLWILVLFLIYLTAHEFNHLFGPGELRHLLFTSRPSELPLNRRQRIHELIRLSKLADTHSVDEFSDPSTMAHAELIDIVRRLAAEPQPHAS
jgi:hypothetical protein